MIRSKPFFVAITGCDSGFGLGLVQNLLAHHPNARIVAGCYTQSGLAQLQNLNKSNLVATSLDVTNSASVTQFTRACSELSPSWDVLVPNAGIGSGWLIEVTSKEDFQRVMDVNFFGVVDVCKQMLPLLKAAPPATEREAKPRILIVSSMLGRISLPGSSAYCASKHALSAFGDGLRREVPSVLTSLLEPGFCATPLIDASIQYQLGLKTKALQAGCFKNEDEFNATIKREETVLKKLSVNPEVTVKEMVKFVTSTSPHVPPHIAVGTDSRFVFRPMGWLPLQVQDWVMKRIF